MADAGAYAHLLTLIDALASPDNAVRSKAEEELQGQLIKNAPGQIIPAMAQVARDHPHHPMRALAAVLFRKLINKEADAEHTVWEILPAESSALAKAILLEALLKEGDSSTRKKVSDTVAEVARLHDEQAPWTELLRLLAQCASSTEASHREVTFLILAAVPDLFGNIPQEQILPLLSLGLDGAQSLVINFAAFKAAIYYLQTLEEHTKQNPLTPLMPNLVQILHKAVAEEAFDTVAGAYEVLIEAIIDHPKLLKPVFEPFVTVTMHIISHFEIDEGARHIALESLISFAEALPPLFRKNKPVTTKMVDVCMQMLTTIEDEEDWYTCERIEDDDADSDATHAEQALDRLARALGGTTLLPITFAHIPTYIAHPEWPYRHAALYALANIAEGCQKLLAKELPKVVGLVLPVLQNDPHPRVRYAACQCIGQLATDFGPALQKAHHAHVLPIMLQLIRNEGGQCHPRVQTHAACALINFLEHGSRSLSLKYMQTVVSALLPVFTQGQAPLYLLEQAVTTLATVAEQTGEAFNTVAVQVIDVMLAVLTNDGTREEEMLRGRAVECVSLAAVAMGEDYKAHLPKTIEIFTHLQQNLRSPEDDQLASYLLSAWARLAQVMKADFTPFLHIVMPDLLKAAKVEPQVTILDADESKEQYDEAEGWEFMNMPGDKKVGVRTSLLDDKCGAIELIGCYASHLRAALQPYIEEIKEIALPLLTFYLHADVRKATATIIPLIVGVYKEAGANEAVMTKVGSDVMQALMKAAASEEDPDVLSEVLSALCDVMLLLGRDCLLRDAGSQFMASLSMIIESNLKEGLRRISEREQQKADEDGDEEWHEQLAEEQDADDAVLGELSRLSNTVFKLHPSSAADWYKGLVPLLDLIRDGSTPGLQWSLCVYDDLIQTMREASWPFAANIVPHIVQHLNHSSPEVRQAACYGVGLMASHGGPQYYSTCVNAMPMLHAVISAPDSSEEEHVFATENAISALGKMIKHLPKETYDYHGLVDFWVDALPVTNDVEEATAVYQLYLTLMEAGLPKIKNDLRKTAMVLAEAICSGVIDMEDKPTEEVKRLHLTLQQALKACLNGLDANTKTALWSQLSEDYREELATLNIL